MSQNRRPHRKHGHAAPAAAARLLVVALLIALAGAGTAFAADDPGSNPLAGVTFSAKAYFDYSSGQIPSVERDDEEEIIDRLTNDYNRFKMIRGYFTFRKQVKPWMSVRLTMDIHQDETGDYKRRDKYFYAELRPGDAGFFTQLKSEIGIGHMPWLDFEEHINPYRCQGTMAVERAGTFNSADVGVSLRGYLGEEMEDAKAKTGNSKYSGRRGSWHVGVYNGGGYHASEENENKLIEGRLTVRPLPDVLPGLQLSYLGIFGKGNIAAPAATADKSLGAIPDYQVNLGMLSYEHPTVTVTGQFFTTGGNAKGKWVDETGKALKTEGYSAFASVKVPGSEGRWSVFGRFDHFDADKDNVIAERTAYDMYLGGVVYDFLKGNLLMLVFESTEFESDFGTKKGAPPETGVALGDDQKVQLVYQIKI